MKSALGYTGSPWEGCIGDIARIPGHPCRNNSTQCAEGHNFASEYCLNSGMAESRIDEAIIEKTLGITGMGNRTGRLNYFTYFNDNCRQRKEFALRQPKKVTTSREKRPKYEGAFVAWKAITSMIMQVEQDILLDSHNNFVFVKAGQSNILGGHLPAVSLSNAVSAVDDAEDVCASFNFERAASAIVPTDVPKRDGYYTVDLESLSCYSCEFWLYHGSGTVKCKHIHAVEIYAEYKRIVAEGGDATGYLMALEADLCAYVRNREKSKRCGVTRDAVFAKGSNIQVSIY